MKGEDTATDGTGETNDGQESGLEAGGDEARQRQAGRSR
jgi:hypothetical protein